MPVPGLPPARYGYFGPAGTFTHQALLTLPALGAEPIPYPTVGLALDAVRDGEVTAVVVPIENSVEGGVTRDPGQPRLRRAAGDHPRAVAAGPVHACSAGRALGWRTSGTS